MNAIQESWEFFREFYRLRQVVFQLARQDFRNRYVGASLGLFWTFVQPLVMTLILWAVVSLAFKTSAVHGVPFVLFLLAGLAVWNCFSEGLGLATGVFYEYAFLVKKVQFQIAVLPLVKILSSLAIHGIFLLFVMGILIVNGIFPSFYWVQILYYMLALVVLLQGVSWITASLNVLAKDVAYMINVLLQFGFWLTPVFWDISLIPAPVQKYFLILLKLNPLAYIVEGYRQSLFYHRPFWADPGWTVYFWVVTLVILVLGGMIFRKLKPHFADVL